MESSPKYSDQDLKSEIESMLVKFPRGRHFKKMIAWQFIHSFYEIFGYISGLDRDKWADCFRPDEGLVWRRDGPNATRGRGAELIVKYEYDGPHTGPWNEPGNFSDYYPTYLSIIHSRDVDNNSVLMGPKLWEDIDFTHMTGASISCFVPDDVFIRLLQGPSTFSVNRTAGRDKDRLFELPAHDEIIKNRESLKEISGYFTEQSILEFEQKCVDHGIDVYFVKRIGKREDWISRYKGQPFTYEGNRPHIECHISYNSENYTKIRFEALIMNR